MLDKVRAGLLFTHWGVIDRAGMAFHRPARTEYEDERYGRLYTHYIKRDGCIPSGC